MILSMSTNLLPGPVRMVFDDELEEIFDDPIKINFGSGGIMNGLLRGKLPIYIFCTVCDPFFFY